MRIAVVVVLALFGGVARADTKDAEAKELEKLAGTWEAVKVVKAGEEAPAEELKMATVTFRGKEIVIAGRGDGRDFRLLLSIKKIDRSRKPAEVDVYSAEDRFLSRGIYRLEDGTLTLCFAMEDNHTRPKEFTSTKKPGTSLMVLKRKK